MKKILYGTCILGVLAYLYAFSTEGANAPAKQPVPRLARFFQEHSLADMKTREGQAMAMVYVVCTSGELIITKSEDKIKDEELMECIKIAESMVTETK